MGGDLVSLHLGQAGVQIGNAVWELFCLEHAVLPNGKPVAEDSGRSVLFAESKACQSVPRVVFCDLEPTCIDEIRTGPYRHLFSADTLVTGKEDAASNFARGYYSIGDEFSELCMDRIRRQAEKCSGIQAFIVFRSFGGGTGSGLSANVMGKIQRDFGKTNILEFSVYPSPRISPIIVEPYNAVLTTHATVDKSKCNFMFDNEALYDICEHYLDVKSPTYTNLNRLMAQVCSCITCCLRFPSDLNIDLIDTLTNLVPYPRIHYPLVSFAPLMTEKKMKFDSASTANVVTDTFNPMNQMIKCDPRTGKYISCVLMFRGQVSPVEVDEAVARVKQMGSVHFVDYSPSGFKVGNCCQPMSYIPGSMVAAVPRSVVSLANSTCIGSAWERVNHKFDLMYQKRAFIHHYIGEGMEEAEFMTARDDLRELQKEYKKAEEDFREE